MKIEIKGKLPSLNSYSDTEIQAIKSLYSNANFKKGELDILSKKLGRLKPNICRKARSMGFTTKNNRQSLYSLERSICASCGKRKVNAPNNIYCSLACASHSPRHKGIWANRPHPKGMLGKTHSLEYRKKLSENLKKRWEDKNNYLNSSAFKRKASERMSKQMVHRIRTSPNSVYSRTQKGWAEIGDKKYYFRSGWELKYANHLEMLRKGTGIINWEYEPDTFWFEKIRRGVRSYTPDFKIYFDDGTFEYHEVKGWLDPKSKTKLKRMAKYYPEHPITLIDASVMKNL